MNLQVQIGHIEFFVKNPLASKEFYCNVLRFEEMVIQAGNFVWLKKDHLEILLRPQTSGSTSIASTDSYEKSKIGLVLYTDDLQKTAKELELRGLNFKGTIDSDKCLTFTDLDGNWFQLVNPNDH
ncbi:MAG: VOC family protein [Chitinophagales bacterium]